MSAYWDFPRSIASARALLAVGAEHGLSQDDCLIDTDLAPTLLQEPLAEIEARQELQIIRNLLRHLGPGIPLGYAAGQRYHPTTYGALGFAILSSPTIGTAVNLAVRYLGLTSFFCRPSVEQRGPETLLLLDATELPEDLRYFLAERDYSTVFSLQHDLLPAQVPVLQVDMALPPPPYPFPTFSDYPVRFDQPRSCIIIESTLMEVVLPQADPYTLARFEGECQQLLERRQRQSSQSGIVRRRLLASSSQIPTLAAMAEQLGMNVRTLQRQLAEQGQVYERLVEEVRRSQAEEWLKTTAFSVEEVATRLGYSEMSAFSRAFKRWTGMAPSHYRRKRDE